MYFIPSINRSASAAPQGMSLLFIFSQGISGSWKQSPFEIYIVLRVVEYWKSMNLQEAFLSIFLKTNWWF
jgi:hypothetical protein